MTKAFPIALVLAVAALLHGRDASAFRSVQASPHVHVFEAGAADTGNVVAIIGKEAILLVDTGHAMEAARRAVASLRRISTLPVRYVVNTHYRGGHLLGNAVFKDAFPDAVFMAHAYTVDEAARFHASIPRSGARTQRYMRPDHVVDDELKVELGGLRVLVRHLGPAHTPGDLIVWVEADKLVATGDMLVAPARQGNEQLQRWVRTIARLRALDPRVIVPGHGPVISDDDDSEKPAAIALLN